jgi:hypothetical protein
MVETMLPDQLFLVGINELSKRSLTNAQVLITEAAQKAEALADTYYKEEAQMRFLFQGMAKLYRSFFNLFKLWFHFGQFDLEEAAEAEDPRPMAREARDLLAEADLRNANWKNCYCLAGAIAAILDALLDAIRVVRATLTRQPVPDIDYAALYKHLKQAEDELAAGGEANLALVQLCQQVTALLKNLRRLVGQRTLPSNKGQVSLFVMMPFGANFKVVEDALRAVLEDEPYWFQLILARDQTMCKNLFDNVKAHMDVVDGFLADISDHNPNVMLELGMSESDRQKRPVFVMRRRESNDPPSDLKGRLYIEYELPPEDAKNRVQILAEQLRQDLHQIDDVKQLLRRRRARYLSMRYIRERSMRARLILEEGETKRLQEEFPTVEELEAANAEHIAQKTGFDSKVAEMIASVFKTKGPVGLKATG